MRRIVALALGLFLFCGADEVFAQGLLGKRHVSGQFLLARFDNDELPELEDTGIGWRAQLNVPLLPSSNETLAGWGVDSFVTGLGFGLSDDVPPGIEVEADFIGVEAGVNVFFEAADWVRPFAQFGVNWNRSKFTASAGPVSISDSDSDTSALLGVGAEFDLASFAALRTSANFDSDGIDETMFANELFVFPAEQWFLRLSVFADTDGNVLGGIGAGFTW